MQNHPILNGTIMIDHLGGEERGRSIHYCSFPYLALPNNTTKTCMDHPRSSPSKSDQLLLYHFKTSFFLMHQFGG